MSAKIQTAQQWQEAYKSGDVAVGDFYDYPCWDLAGPVAARMAGMNPLTAEDAREWKEFLRPHVNDEALLTPIDELTRGAVCVVTGQQAGAALGPLYSLYKAFAAIHWAAEVRKSGTPCIAVFWIASDDHDIAEIREAKWLTSGGELSAAALASDETKGRPAFAEPLDADLMKQFVERLEVSTAPTEFRGEVIEALKNAFADGANFESQFVSLFCKWLLPLGIIPIVPRLGFMRRRMGGVITREIERFAETNREVVAGGKRVEAIGPKAPLHRNGDEVNFFLDVDGVRGKVTSTDGKYRISEPIPGGKMLAEITDAELRAIAKSDPQRFSPNAILRPLAQDAALPTVGYVGGPSEVLYHGQIGNLYRDFGVTRPAVLPRPNVFLLDTKIEKALQKLGAANEGDFLDIVNDAIAGTVASPTSAIADSALEKVRTSLDEFDQKIRELNAGTGVVKALEKLQEGANGALGLLQQRITQFAESQDGDRLRAKEKVRQNLLPGGGPHEREVGMIAPLMVNYGAEILAPLQAAIVFNAAGFQAVKLGGLVKGAAADYADKR
ncbi:bacillithiol biosynthesis cysteine-adding enzyme BshC [soil metagenome]